MNKKELAESYSLDDIYDVSDCVKAILKDDDYFNKYFDFAILNLDENELTKEDKKFLHEDMKEKLLAYFRKQIRQNIEFSKYEKIIPTPKELNLSAIYNYIDDFDDETLELLRPIFYDIYIKLYDFEFSTCHNNSVVSEETINDNRMFTALNADDVKIGSIGYVANTLAELEKKIDKKEETVKIVLIKEKDCQNRFVDDCAGESSLFYMVQRSNDYVPYKNTKEMLEDYSKRLNVSLLKDAFELPCMRIKNTVTNGIYLVLGIEDQIVYTADSAINLKDLNSCYIFADGKPCGKK